VPCINILHLLPQLCRTGHHCMQTTNGQIALHLLTPNATNTVCTTIASLSYAALVKAILLSSLHNCGTQIIVIAVTCAAGQTIRDPLLGRWLLHIPMFRPTVMGLLSFSSLLLLPFQLLLLVLQSNSMMMVTPQHSNPAKI